MFACSLARFSPARREGNGICLLLGKQFAREVPGRAAVVLYRADETVQLEVSVLDAQARPAREDCRTITQKTKCLLLHSKFSEIDVNFHEELTQFRFSRVRQRTFSPSR